MPFSISTAIQNTITLDTGVTLRPGQTVSADNISYATYDLYKRGFLSITPTPIYDSASGLYTPAENLDGIYNASSDNLRTLRTAVNNARSGISRAKIAISGHSVARGTGAGSGTGGTADGQIYNFFTQLQKILKGLGYPATCNNLFSSGARGNDALLPLADPRAYFAAGSWGETAQEVVGGPLLRNNTDAGAFRLTIADAVDTVDVYDRVSVGAKSIQVSKGGALSGNLLNGTETNLSGGLLSQNAADAVRKTTLPLGALAATTINVVKATGTIAYLVGLDAYDSTKPDIAFLNFARAGAGSITYSQSSQVYHPINTISLFGINALFDMNGINDINNGVAIDTHISQREAWLKAVAATGALPIVLTDPPISVTSATNSMAVQTLYRDSISDMAIRNGWPLGDVFGLFKDYIRANTAGLYYDTVHPRRNAHFMIAEMLSDFFIK